MTLPRILVLSLGGTITMTASAGGGIAPTLGAQDLVAAVPGLAQRAQVEAVSLFGLPGASLTLPHLLQVARTLQQHFDAGVAGAVVVQGTDTIEDTAFVLDVLGAAARPVVVTGAMRGAQAAGADGPANLLAAVTVAADPRLAGLGVVVVLNDEIHAARLVQKMHTGLPNAFASPGAGPLGGVSEGRVRLVMRPVDGALRLAPPTPGDPPPVAAVPLGLGEDGRLLAALPGLGYAGAVVELMGAGHAPAAAVAPLQALAAQMPVVFSSRVRGGPLFTDTYGFDGSERDLIARGLIPAGALSTSKARLLLSLLLAAGADRERVRAAFG